MKSVDQHQADCLDVVRPLGSLDLQLLDAHGCILAEDVVAPWDLPPFDNSSMDGYAVLAADVAGASGEAPLSIPVLGDIPAGHAAAMALRPGTAMRIMTGAPMPPGADAVVPVEWTDGGVAQVSITQPAAVGEYVRPAGGDVRAGEMVLASGTRLGPAQLGLLAAVGRDRVVCRPKPRVVVLSTGSELVDPGQLLQPGQISESNSFMLATAAKESGAVAYRVGTVRDDPRGLLDAIEDQLIRADLVITTGGVSAGAYDVVKQVLQRLGTVTFDKVAMQPGMPQGFGTVGPDSTPIFTLPGNPVSAYVSFEVFVRPVLRKMLGVEPLHRPTVRAVCATAMQSPAGKRQFARAQLSVEDGRYVVRPMSAQGSHLINDLAHANCLVIVPEDVTEVPAGGAVTVMVLERRLS
ncbi:MAG TPA: gephyrin-like molybdotransferase Glp [Actinomycetes bacterium]